MTILITGGAGFIGSTLAQRLLHDGHTVLVADNFNEAYEPALKWLNIRPLEQQNSFRLFVGDIRRPAFLANIFTTYAIDAVVHLAGLAGVRASLQNPTAYFDHNLNGTTIVLEAMRSAGVDRLIVASSSSVYGSRQQGPFKESDPVDEPVSPYALSKRAVETLCRQYHQLYGINTYCLRLFTVYGPRQRPDMAISRFLHQLYTGEPIRAFGGGNSHRDYTYIDDIVDGITRAVDRVDGYEVINLGSAAPVSLRELIGLLNELTNRSGAIDWQPEQPGDVPLTYACIDKAYRLLGYQPATDIRKGLGRMIQHQSVSCLPVLP